MYGKIFEDIFCSTLMNHGGDTAYVFIAMIVLSDENGIIKHTAESLARLICKDVDSVKTAIKNLEAQDLSSNLKGHEGRRIVPLCELNKDETRGWLIVNKANYRDRGSKDDRREYMREYMRDYRNENKAVNSSKPQLAKLGHTDTDTDTNTKTKTIGGFPRFWTAWPRSSRKQSKGECERCWRKKDLDKAADEIVAHVEAMKLSMDWRKDGGTYIPAPLVYLNQRRWEGAEQPAPGGEKRMVI